MVGPVRYVGDVVKTYFLRRGPLLARGIAFSILVGAVPLLVLALYGASTLFALAPVLKQTLVLRLDELLPAELANSIQSQAALIASHSWAEIGLVTLLALVIVAQGIFASVEGGLSIIMRCPQERRLWLDNLLYISLTVFAIVMFFAASYAHMFLNMLSELVGSPAWLGWLARKMTSLLILWSALAMIYRICYHGKVSLWGVLGVSAGIAIVWQFFNAAASSIITAMGQRELFYGFLASVVVFLLWAYTFAVLLLVGGIIIARHSKPFRHPSGDSEDLAHTRHG